MGFLSLVPSLDRAEVQGLEDLREGCLSFPLVLVGGGLGERRGRRCGEVHWSLPKGTHRSGRFSSKPCFYMWVNWEPSEQYSFSWAQGLGPWLLRENRFDVCCMRDLG